MVSPRGLLPWALMWKSHGLATSSFPLWWEQYTSLASPFHASVCPRRTFVPVRRGLIIPDTDRIVPGNALVYNLPEASRQKVKHERKKKKTPTSKVEIG